MSFSFCILYTNNATKISGTLLELKGHCHAIWQLYKSYKVSLHQLNSKTNDLVLLLETI